MLTLQSRRNNGNCLNKIKDALTRSFLPPIISSISRLCFYHVLAAGVVLVLLSSPRFFGNPLINEAQQLISYINDTT